MKRYTQRFFQAFDIQSHELLVDGILSACLAADLIPEVNLSSLRQQLPEPMPAVGRDGDTQNWEATP